MITNIDITINYKSGTTRKLKFKIKKDITENRLYYIIKQAFNKYKIC